MDDGNKGDEDVGEHGGPFGLGELRGSIGEDGGGQNKNAWKLRYGSGEYKCSFP